MGYNEIDLVGKICPYPVVEIIKAVDRMRSGEKLTFSVDDPLCLKSVPDELEDYEDIEIIVDKMEKGWKIQISKR